MTKLRLNLDDLCVDTFHTSTLDAAWKGTVQAHDGEATLKTVCASLLASNPTCCPCTPMV